MFEAKEQQFTDSHTGVTIAFGRHAATEEELEEGGPEATGKCFMMITVPKENPDDPDEGAKGVTVLFDGGGEIASITPHDYTVPPEPEQGPGEGEEAPAEGHEEATEPA